MIEKFTKEELEIIKRELAELPKGEQKRPLCMKYVKNLTSLFRHRTDYPGISPERELEDAIFVLIDHTLCNYGINPNKPNRMRREVFVLPELKEQYVEMFGKIYDLIENNFQYCMKEDE